MQCSQLWWIVCVYVLCLTQYHFCMCMECADSILPVECTNSSLVSSFFRILSNMGLVDDSFFDSSSNFSFHSGQF